MEVNPIVLLLLQENLRTKSLKKWLFSQRKNNFFINFVLSQQSQVTVEYPDLTL